MTELTEVPEPDVEAAVALTSRLVQMRTVNEPGAAVVEAPAARLLYDLMRSFDWHVTLEEVVPGRPNVVAIVDGAGPGRTLMFEGHTDVVTEGDRDEWDFYPFAGDVVDGRLRGRGAADMKSGVAAMIYAARAVELGGFVGRIIVAALADEEGMMLGVKDFAASPLAAAGIDGVIVCEPEGGEVCAVAKGAMRIRIDLQGVMAHGAMPQHGRSPIPALGQLLIGLGELQQKIAETVGPHEHLGEFYLTPTVLQAGSVEQVNVIPATASMLLDVRTIPAVAHEPLLLLITKLTETIAAEAGLRSAVTVLDDRPPVDTPVDAPVVSALARAHEQVTGEPARFGGVPGTTDGTILTRDAGLQTVVYGPGGKWIAHQANEFVEVADIVTATKVYAAAARIFLAESA
jgi:succinyl-diaminopimelate desuccinylase